MRGLPTLPTLLRLAALASLGSLVACSSLKDDNAPPDGLTCGRVVNGGGDAQSLTAALAGAQAGSCVLVVTQTYTGSFKVPAGVMLASAKGSRASFAGTDTNAPAIDIAGDPGGSNAGGAWGIDVTHAAQVGVAVRGGAARLHDVSVTGAASAGVAALCTDQSCRDGSHVLTLEDVRLTGNDTGLWSNGEDVAMSGGESSQNSSQSLTGGNGIVVFGGAHLALDGTAVANNDQVGILLDGNTGATTGTLNAVQVTSNGSRGIWAQGLAGTVDAPSLSITGATSISSNKLVGLGASDTHGIIFVGGKIESTVTAPVLTNLGHSEDVGDGFGVFGDSGDIKLDTVDLSGNARASGLIDQSSLTSPPKGVIIFVGGKVDAGASGLKIVEQNLVSGGDSPQISGDLLSTPSSTLGFSAPKIAVGAIIQ